MSKAHCNDLPQRKALGMVTHDNTGGPFVVECQGCGEVYPSFHCLGGEQIADTGDHEDARCPHCDQVDPHECDNAALAWNVQQLKINELQQRLTAADERADVLEGLVGEVLDAIGREPLDLDAVLRLRARMRAALKPAEAPRNQCDGCQAGIPLINGTHRMGREGGYPDFMGCSAKLYKPAEGGGDVARLALRPENQRITPARFKYLACGEYHEGSGNLPCPSMSPYSRIEQ